MITNYAPFARTPIGKRALTEMKIRRTTSGAATPLTLSVVKDDGESLPSQTRLARSLQSDDAADGGHIGPSRMASKRGSAGSENFSFDPSLLSKKGKTMNRQMKKRRAGRTVVAILALTASAGIGVIGLSTSVSSAAARTPNLRSATKPAGTTYNWHNKLGKNTNGWCPVVSPPNAPCDGASGDYGTIGIYSPSDQDASWGGYGAGVTLTGQKKYARTTGGTDDSGNGGAPSPTGCTVQGNENCSGPFALWGPKNQGDDTIFPSGGFTTTIKVYVDAVWGDANPGNVVDWDTGLETSTGAYEEDFVIDLCSTASGWEVTWENGSGGCGATAGTPNPEYLNTSGWYTLQMNFTNGAGTVYAAYSVLSDGSTGQSTPTQVWSYSENSGISTASSGGPLYGWLPTEDVSGLPLAQIRLEVN
jgi:hypothetical protein